MYLPQTEEQRMLGEAALRYLRDVPRPSLAEVARLGWIGAAFEEADGGQGGRAADVAPLCEAIGRAGATLAWFSAVLLPAMLLRHVADARTRAGLIEGCIGGSMAFAVAHQEAGTAFEASSGCAAAIDAAGCLVGVKERVWGADAGTALLVSVQGRAGPGVALVDAGAPGLRFDAVHADASLPWARVVLERTPAKLLIEGEAARAALAEAADFALVGVLAETVGLMHAAFEDTSAWLATRRQFGRPLAANQVLQHRLADMFIALEESRSMLNLAIHAHDHAESAHRRPALHAARVHIAHAARMVGQSAVHLHGAMGITEELGAGRAYRRIEQLGAVFGGADHHLARYVALNGGRP